MDAQAFGWRSSELGDQVRGARGSADHERPLAATRERLIGTLRRDGVARKQAERKVDEWFRWFDPSHEPSGY